MAVRAARTAKKFRKRWGTPRGRRKNSGDGHHALQTAKKFCERPFGLRVRRKNSETAVRATRTPKKFWRWPSAPRGPRKYSGNDGARRVDAEKIPAMAITPSKRPKNFENGRSGSAYGEKILKRPSAPRGRRKILKMAVEIARTAKKLWAAVAEPVLNGDHPSPVLAFFTVQSQRDEAERRIEEARKRQDESLDLGDLELEDLPASLGTLTQLRELYLGMRGLDETGKPKLYLERGPARFADLSALAGLSGLQNLNLWQCMGVTDLSAGLSGLQNLPTANTRRKGRRSLKR